MLILNVVNRLGFSSRTSIAVIAALASRKDIARATQPLPRLKTLRY